MKLFKKFTLALVLLSITTTSMSGVESTAIQNSFDQMTNVTSPGSYQGQTRGVITGGEFFQKNKVSKGANLFDVRMPSIKSGCSGTDAFGGSLSFINATQFEGLLKNIAQNARGYAFQLAMDIACPTCSANMKLLQDRIQSMNAKMKSSCELATTGINALVDSTSWGASQRKKAQTAAVSGPHPVFKDLFGAEDGDPNAYGTNPAKELSAAEDKSADLVGNVVWRALSEQQVGNWYGYVTPADVQMMNRILMSTTGTIVSLKKDVQGTSGGTEVAYTPVQIDATITVKDLIYGKPNDQDPTLATVWKCVLTSNEDAGTNEYGADSCLMTTMELMRIEGFLPKVKLMLEGDGGVTSTGIIEKMADKGMVRTFTMAEQSFITASSPGVLGILRSFATDLRAARQVSGPFAVVMAQEMATHFTLEMIENVRKAVSSHKNTIGLKEQMKSLLDKKYAEVLALRGNDSHTLQGLNFAFQNAKYVKDQLQEVKTAQK